MYVNLKVLSIVICLGIYLTFYILRNISRRAENAKVHFIGTLSHDLKTPITSLTIALSMLDRSGYDAELVHIANKDVERLRILLEGMLKTTHKGARNNETHLTG